MSIDADDNFFVRLTGHATTAKLEKTASSEQATGDGGGEDVAGLSTDEQENFCVQQCFKDEYETEDVDLLAEGGSTNLPPPPPVGAEIVREVEVWPDYAETLCLTKGVPHQKVMLTGTVCAGDKIIWNKMESIGTTNYHWNNKFGGTGCKVGSKISWERATGEMLRLSGAAHMPYRVLRVGGLARLW